MFREWIIVFRNWILLVSRANLLVGYVSILYRDFRWVFSAVVCFVLASVLLTQILSHNLNMVLDIQSWWEVPSIAHFCSLFRAAFNLLDFDIEVSQLLYTLRNDQKTNTYSNGSSLWQSWRCYCFSNLAAPCNTIYYPLPDPIPQNFTRQSRCNFCNICFL